MKIVHVAQAREPGGLLRVVDDLARAQSARHAVRIAAPVDPRRGSPGVPFTRHRVEGNSHLLAQSAVRTLLRREAADVAVLHAASPGEMAWPRLLLAPPCPLVILEHAPGHHPLARAVRDAIHFRLKRRAERWLAVSRDGARALERRARLPEGAIGHVHCGVGAPDDTPPGNEALRDAVAGGRAVVAFGTPGPVKGFDLFSRVARELAPLLPGSRWVWIGGSVQEESGQPSVFPRVASIGWIVRRAALVLLPSRAEGLPLVLLEAWAAGAPVIAASVGGIPEAVGESGGARMVPPDDAAALADAVTAAWRDEASRAAVAAAGNARWRESFTLDAMAARWDALLEGVVPDRSGKAAP